MNDIRIIGGVQKLTGGHDVIIFVPKNAENSIGTDFAICKVPTKGDDNG